MNSKEAADKIEKIVKHKTIRKDYQNALQLAIEALRGNPCAVCIYSPPSAGDGRPCAHCPAVGR